MLFQLKKALEDLTELLSEKEALAQRCQELDIQVNTELIHTLWNFYRKMDINMIYIQLSRPSALWKLLIFRSQCAHRRVCSTV